MTDTPRVTDESLQKAITEPGFEFGNSVFAQAAMLDLRDSRALAQSQAATIAERNAEIEQLKGRKPFKLEVSKEWCLRMAESEGDAVIGAGVPGPEHKASSMLAEALAEIDRLHSIYIQACNGRAEIREALMAERSANAALTERLARAEVALSTARRHIVTLHPAGDPRNTSPRDMQDQVQIAVLDVIDAALIPIKEP